MKNKITLTIIFSLVISGQAFGHGGGLDAQGGHTNRKTGEYHYHRGPSKGKPAGVKQPAAGGAEEKQIVGVASVIDGDTIEIHGQRIRLHGIDAPESKQLCVVDGKPWRCGAEAANRISETIGRKTVLCDWRDKDRYGRVVAVCSVDGKDLNAWMVSEGLAVAYRKYSADYVGQEDEAKVGRRGVWASEFDMPWDWRKTKK